MATFQGVIGTQGAVTGATTIVIDDRIFQKSASRTMWDKGVFAISVTRVGTGANFSCYVVGNLSGVQIPIAGISGIGTTTTTILPLVQERVLGTGAAGNSAQVAMIGIPMPRQIVFGNSALAGQTYAAVVSAMLQSED